MRSLFAIAVICLVSPTQAATLGANCGGRAQIIVAPTQGEAMSCATARGCMVGFNVRSGYFAIAQTTSGRKYSSTSGGFRKQASADERALDRCHAFQMGPCTIIARGHDNGRKYLNCQ